MEKLFTKTRYFGSINITVFFGDEEYNGTLSAGGDLSAYRNGNYYTYPRVQVGGVFLGGGNSMRTRPTTYCNYGAKVPGDTAAKRKKWLEDNGFLDEAKPVN